VKLFLLLGGLFISGLSLVNEAYATSCRMTVTYNRPDGSQYSVTNCIANGGPQCNSGPGGYCVADTSPNPGLGIVSKNCQPVNSC
jgi:hypothetical protein